jgi:hypothetical protein
VSERLREAAPVRGDATVSPNPAPAGGTPVTGEEPAAGDDPEPCDRPPGGPLYVPVLPGPAGAAARLFRTPLGGRTAVAFTSERRLTVTLGPGQRWVTLAEPALRALAAPLGVTALVVDPQLAAPAVAPHTPAPAAPAVAPDPRRAAARVRVPSPRSGWGRAAR